MHRREALERVHADLGRILAEQPFANIDEANAFLDKLLKDTGGRIPRRAPATPLEEAQDLCWEAWDEPDPRRAAFKAKRALRTSPDCADAYNILAACQARTAEEALALYEKGVRAGERALGEAYFKENKGHFWGLLETRPYMRAREGVARCLWELGRLEEAAAHYEAMLALNPNDNQGNRSALLAIQLRLGRVGDAAKLLARYPDDVLADLAWTRVLVEFLQGRKGRARRRLREAMRYNPHVPRLLLGKTRARYRGGYVTFGGADEAAAYVDVFGASWRERPEALSWLRSALPAARR